MAMIIECIACGHWQVRRGDLPECECCGCFALVPVKEDT